MVQFIPKEAPRPAIGLNLLLVCSLLLLVLTAGSYFVFDKLIKENENIKQDLEAKINQEKTTERETLRKEMEKYEQKINDFKFLIDQHLQINPVFEAIEKNTHPQVMFTTFNLAPRQNQLKLTGETNNFAIVGQQIALFQKDETAITQVNLDKISIDKKGRIVFDLSLIFKPDFFKF